MPSGRRLLLSVFFGMYTLRTGWLARVEEWPESPPTPPRGWRLHQHLVHTGRVLACVDLRNPSARS